MADETERIVFYRALGMIFARLDHSSVHVSPEQIAALGAFCTHAAEESLAGLHEAPPLPASTLALGSPEKGLSLRNLKNNYMIIT